MQTRRKFLGYCIAAASAAVTTGIQAESVVTDIAAKNLIDGLRLIGKDVCLSSANRLQTTVDPTAKISLHLRSAGLDSDDARILANALDLHFDQGGQQIRSFSVSYNPMLGDDGVLTLSTALPPDVSDIGFVGCGIGDEGGTALLRWAQKSTQLRMICVEGNSFSDGLIASFHRLSDTRPGLLVVV